MPKLADRVQKFVDKQEASYGYSFEPIPVPKVIGTLKEVREEEGEFSTQWVAVFGDLVDLAGKEWGGQLFYRMTIPGGSKPPAGWAPYIGGVKREDASAAERADAWKKQIEAQGAKLHGFFEIVGYATNSDTDELINEKYGLNISVRSSTKDPTRKYNQVDGLFDANQAGDDGGFGAEGGDGTGAGGDDSDDF